MHSRAHPTDAPSDPSPAAAPGEASGPAPLEALNEIARIATLDLELRPMLQRITDALRRHFGWELVACVSVDAERGVFVCEAVSSSVPTQVAVGYTQPLGNGVVGQVALTGRAVVLDDAARHPGYVDTLGGTASELCVPVRHGGRTVAILNVESRTPRAFSDQLPLLETVAEQVAGAIASARLYEEARRRMRLLEMVGEVSRRALQAGELDALLERVVEYIHDQFPALSAAILLLDPPGERFQEAAHVGGVPLQVEKGTWWPLRAGVVGRALRTGEPQLVLDVGADSDYFSVHEGIVAEYAAPIRFRGRTLGALNLESTTAEAFTPENVVVFRTFAHQVAGAIHLAAMNRELEMANASLLEANRRLERLSLTDPLTGLANRRHFDEVLASEWRRAQRAGAPVSAIMLDLDFFKAFNDHAGHRAGDQCLRRVSECMRVSLRRAGDLAARYGGEEFVLLLPDTDAAGAAAFAERLRAMVEELGVAHPASPVAPVVTCSLGVATAFPREGLEPFRLLDEADRALYHAKSEGRNRVRHCPWVAPRAPHPSATPTPGAAAPGEETPAG